MLKPLDMPRSRRVLSAVAAAIAALLVTSLAAAAGPRDAGGAMPVTAPVKKPTPANATPTDVSTAEAAATIRKALQASRPNLAVETIEPSAVPGIFAVQLQNGPLIYATRNASHFFVGDLFSIQPDGFVNLAEQKRDQLRATLIAGVKPADTIAFKPDGETRAVVHVFTDVDCVYCQMLHQHVAEYNALGIEIRYLAFPRAGLGSESHRKIASAWCAADRRAALTRLKQRQPIPTNVCDNNPVAEQFELGRRMGVEGTPALITATGALLPGYLPPAQLAQTLGIESPAAR